MTQFGLPFVVAVNRFPGTPDHTPSQVRDLLRLPDSVPVVTCDARERASALNALTVLGDCLATLRLLT
jgi:signal recognition particle receptor subunit beta